MNNKELTTTKTDALAVASGVDLVTIRLDKLRFPRIAKMDAAQVVTALHTIVTHALMLRGMQPSLENVVFTAQTLYEKLMEDEDGIGLKYLTIEEIRREVTAAALGSRGELYGVNVASLYGVLKEYALGAGHVAQAEAARRQKAAYDYATKKSAVGIMLTAAAGEIAKNSKIK